MPALNIRDALTTAMMHSEAPMVLCDPHVPDCPMIAVNQAFCDMSGYKADTIVGQNCRFLQGPRTDAFSTARIRASLDAGLGCIEWLVNYRQDGEMFYNLLFISPVRDRDGSLLYYFGNQLDITMGAPAWLKEVSFGTAHVVPDLEQEFHALMQEVTVAARTQALERIVAAAHRLAEISTKLAPGVLETVKPRRA
jgi:PAS domain S-box-containing protein